MILKPPPPGRPALCSRANMPAHYSPVPLDNPGMVASWWFRREPPDIHLSCGGRHAGKGMLLASGSTTTHCHLRSTLWAHCCDLCVVVSATLPGAASYQHGSGMYACRQARDCNPFNKLLVATEDRHNCIQSGAIPYNSKYTCVALGINTAVYVDTRVYTVLPESTGPQARHTLHSR